jgi:Cft2 family RNA processing exonuclease
VSTIEFTSLGGSGEVGASSHLIAGDGIEILLDCGMHPKKEGLQALPALSLLRRSPEAVLVTHGHIDHCGCVPYLLKNFPNTTPYATAPTVSIMDRMLHNSVSVMETIALERGIQGYPLFTHSDVEYAIRRSYGLEYDQEFALHYRSDVRASFHSAGHVLGSASVLLRFEGHSVFYTGDVCTTDQVLLQGFSYDNEHPVDTLIIESTYGATSDAGAIRNEDEVARFGREATKVLAGGGAVLVPAFALGRTQEMLNMIDLLQEQGDLPPVKVYASGLGRAIYEVYGKYSHYLRPGAELSSLNKFKRIGDVWERGVVRELIGEPCIIVATSGMVIQNTPSAMIAQEMVRHTHHGIFFVGYLDPDTLGHKLRTSKKNDELVFEVGGKPVKVRMENFQRFHFSAHAPREALLDIIEKLTPKNIVFVHGDPDAIAWMKENANSNCRKFAPAIGKVIRLES